MAVQAEPWHADSRLLVAVILLCTFAASTAALGFGFVFDDHALIVENPTLRSWRFLPRYFTGHLFSFEYPHLLGNYYRPLFLLWLRSNYFAFGLSAWKWHFAGALLHVAATWLVYELARRIVKDTWTAAMAAMIFGLHPVHIEVTAYLSGQAESLAAVLVLASFMFYLSWQRAPAEHSTKAKGRLVISVSLYALALLAKEAALSLPIFILAYELIFTLSCSPLRTGADLEGLRQPKPGPLRALATALGAYLTVAALYLAARALALKGLAHVVSPISTATLLLTTPRLLLFYLRLLVWPVGLSPYYDTSYVPHFGLWEVALPALAIAAFVAALGFWWLKTRNSRPEEGRAVDFACVLMAVPILPVLDLRFLPPGEIAHDRYLYLPSIGFAILAALALSHLHLGRALLLGRPALQVVAVVALAAILGCAMVDQSLYWADELSLDYRAHRLAPNNVSATTSLASAAAARGLYPAAIELYQQVLARQPDFWRANVNLAYLYYQRGNYAEAEKYFLRSIEADPSDGNQYLYLGLVRMQTGRLELAESDIRRALVVRPDGPEYHLALGMVLKARGNAAAALQEFKAELANNPDDAKARQLAAETEAGLP